MKRLLMVAFHFPPAAGSSGIQRTLRFVQHLPEFGWEPVVLTVVPGAHERTSTDLLAEVPPGVQVIRAFAVDTARHLSVAGRYAAFLARPDRWQSWRWGASIAGLRALRTLGCSAIWSTYPIATAHRIGAILHRRSGVPWVADFRDPMAQDGYPSDPRVWRSYKEIEERAILQAARSVFTTPGAARMYRERYHEASADRIAVIENGYDEDTFAAAERDGATRLPLHPHRMTLLHSGIVYPSERDPRQLLQALASLKADGLIRAASFCIRFRASEHDGLLQRLASEAGVADLIELLPPVPYHEALQEMLRADGLLVLQASNCNAQVPAKLYEYLRAQRPILGLTDPMGDTARVLRQAGVPAVAALDSANGIAQLLRRFIIAPEPRSEWSASPEAMRRASRRARTAELAEVLRQATSMTPSAASH